MCVVVWVCNLYHAVCSFHMQTAIFRRARIGRSGDDNKHWLQYAVPKYSVRTIIMYIYRDVPKIFKRWLFLITSISQICIFHCLVRKL